MKEKRPNILLIVTDQQPYNGLSSAGNPYLKTPGMDSIAEAGTRFEMAYCASPVCGPSRASISTGCMPNQTGVKHNNIPPSPDLKNIGELLKEAGYETMWGGKWHNPEPYPAQNQMKSIPGCDVLPFYEDARCDKDWLFGSNTDGPLTQELCKYLSKPKDKPFFLTACYHNPHDICFYHELTDKFPPPEDPSELPPLPENFEIDTNEPELIQACRKKTRYGGENLGMSHYNEKQWQEYLYTSHRLTEEVDREISQLLNALDKEGLREDTLVIFCSDHGNGNASHHWASKLSLYEEASAVPLIFQLPGKIQSNATEKNHAVSLIDILPTICDYAGIETPSVCPGQSLRGLLEGRIASLSREYAVTHVAPFERGSDKGSWEGRMIRSKEYKYCVYSHGERNEQLFSMFNDRNEAVNLVNDPVYESVVSEHRDLLLEWCSKTNDSFVAEIKTVVNA